MKRIWDKILSKWIEIVSVALLGGICHVAWVIWIDVPALKASDIAQETSIKKLIRINCKIAIENIRDPQNKEEAIQICRGE